jgi:methylaspartate ammonia-lyase
MKIVDVLCSAGKTGFFFDDQKAMKSHAKVDGSTYSGKPLTPGFNSVRQPGESISVMFILEDGQIAYGDCCAVQYSGASGRDPLFLADEFIPIIQREITPLFKGKEITTFKEMAKLADSHVDSVTNKILHTAIRYGVTQTILDAVAKNSKKLMAEVVADEYGLKMSTKRIAIFCQSGDDRYNNTDKMILKGADVLPHALINHVEGKLGVKGEKLVEYLKWLKERVTNMKATDDYAPIFHIDVYGTFGVAFDYDAEKIVNYMAELEKIAHPFKLRIEGPVDTGERESQILLMTKLTEMCDSRGINVEIVSDEWCNTLEDVIDFTDRKAGHMAQIKTPDLGGINNSIEAVLYCQQNGMGAYLGGSCNETEKSAHACINIAMATSPIQILSKPGMGVDEAYMLSFNEMNRILALSNRSK